MMMFITKQPYRRIMMLSTALTARGCKQPDGGEECEFVCAKGERWFVFKCIAPRSFNNLNMKSTVRSVHHVVDDDFDFLHRG